MSRASWVRKDSGGTRESYLCNRDEDTAYT